MLLRHAAVLICLIGGPLTAQGPLTRTVRGGTLTSKADPAATFVIDTAFHYVGGQVIDIMKVAGAEQHFFFQAARDSSVQRFYWLQFEHYYPSNTHVYDYSEIKQQPVALGAITFGGDIRTRANYFTMDDRPGSDSKAAEVFLRGKGLKLDGTFVTLRMFHLTDETRRREVMIIYGERVSDAADAARATNEIVAHAQAALRVH